MQASAQGYYLQSIQFNDGTFLELKRNSIIIITGPNNCGKSRTLKEISHHPIINRTSIITSKIESVFEGNFFAVISDLLRHPLMKPNRALIEQIVSQAQGNPNLFFTLLSQSFHPYRHLLDGVMTHLSTITRLLSFGVSPESAGFVNVQPFGMTSLVRLFEDHNLARKVYESTKSAFGKGVLMNHSTLQDNDLYFFNKEDIELHEKEGTTAYARWFESMEKLNAQGDGVHSFVTILISLFQGLTPLILLDEPEAFLHPPQIRELARIVATQTPEQTQLVVATHSDDFIRGMMDFASNRISVVRMTRHKHNGKEINRIKNLDADQISALWNDPLLKTSDVLASLFHQVAIIVEGDSDARFFRSMVDALSSEQHRALDIKFFHCGGKDKIPKIATALRAIGVSVLCIVDIDIIDDKIKFSRLVQAFGGDPSTFEKPHDEILTFMSQKQTNVPGLMIKEEIVKIFNDIDLTIPLQELHSKKMIEILKPKSSWASAKQSGESFFSGGVPFNMFQHICGEAEKIGIFINKVGELENYCRSLSAKRKGDWLAEVLSLDLQKDVNLRDARDFTNSLLALCRKEFI